MSEILTAEQVAKIDSKGFLPEVFALTASHEALRAENDRLEALFQQTHGVHHSWVHEGTQAQKLRAENEALRAERDAWSDLAGDLSESHSAASKRVARLEAALRNVLEHARDDGSSSLYEINWIVRAALAADAKDTP